MNTKICPICKSPIPPTSPGGFCPACLLRDAEEPAPSGRAAPSLAEVADAFPQLEVLALIGQGGMGFVYKVRQPALDRTVALKILSPELSRDPAFAERFAREARVLGKLNHPNIVTVFEHGQTTLPLESGSQLSTKNSQPFFYLLMEYVDGVNLRQAMRAGRFTPPQALAVVPGICDALQAAHAQGVWHRDIKPENILLDARGGVKIADFGIARIVGDPGRDFTLTATGAALGSAAYMAPEQHERPHDVDHRADIYSLGVVIYEMLTGELPLGRFPAPSRRATVSARIDDIVLRTLEKERELRQQSATEVKTDMQGAAQTGGGAEPAGRAGQPAPVTLWGLGLTLGGLAMLGGAVAFTYGSTQGVLLTFAAVAVVLGFVASCIAHSQMRRKQIPTHGRLLLLMIVILPPGIVVLAVGLLLLFRARSIDHARTQHRQQMEIKTSPRLGPKALGATPEEAMQAILKAARERDKQALRAGCSRSLQAIADDETHQLSEEFKSLRRLNFVRARTLNETTAEVILRSTDDEGKEREIPFQMIMEDGAWKLTEVGHSTPISR